MSADPSASLAADLDDEAYDSAEDEDFQLDAAQDDSELSSDDDETTEPAKKKRKTDKKAKIATDELDSGDEATIKKAHDKRNKKHKGKKGKGKGKDVTGEGDDSDIDFDEDEGDAGGFVRTRAMKKMRREEEEQRKPLARIDGATVDVEALWAQMNTPGNDLGMQSTQIHHDDKPLPDKPERTTDTNVQDHGAPEPQDNARHGQYGEHMIKIKRTYKFAGEWITEEKVVPKDSAEAKAFLSSGDNAELAEVGDTAADAARNLRRPLRKISRFDPNPTGTIKKSWEKQPTAEVGVDHPSGPKINTVEKSRLDWAQYVDQAGIKDELRTHSKAKEGYIGRMNFLDRMGAKRDEEARQARLKGM
ncbi:Craniofacial development protein 1/Bucentaur [Penicillium macrosclerotiorum]|uniref:Craniofacial development protein 1/Bucentaur n=1 Tax=Penicillium macrosclerotiorum TaxID=303699 RepID=UPI0025485102|nr:Craniofacial development protein 1/Bucentaur [Penicillium macrosclerotiorum]KAJ5682952.1 Craniofacial development protein 1/Bucentaur [Penicillium macrosclerotiorum]